MGATGYERSDPGRAEVTGPEVFLGVLLPGWSTPQRVSPQSMPLAWLADGGLGAMVGDYVSVSWVGGRPLAMLALATQPESDTLREAIFAVSAA